MTRDSLLQAKVEAEQRAKFPATRAGHVHPEAFCIMAYRCRQCGHIEHIWNSRDGVSPFLESCPKCDDTAHHSVWQFDWFRPGHKPLPGERIFVDLTREHALEAAPDIMARSAASGYPYDGTPEEFAEVLLKSASPGSPHTVTVTEEMARERGWVK